MSKSLTLSMSLAIALSCTGVSFAGHGGCDTCGLASPQGVVASPQASAQSYETCDTCTTKKKHNFKLSMPSCLKHKPKMYTYEWVLKKKRVWGCHNNAGCGTGCETGGCSSPIYPSSQSYASPQAYGSGQAYSSGQAYGAPQAYTSGQAYGAPQASAYGAPQATGAITTAPAAPATTDEVPPAPDAPAPAAPAPAPAAPAPAPAPANAPQSSLLFSTPSGN